MEKNEKAQHGQITSGPVEEDKRLELWKHFATTGGADKNTMVHVASWLLGLSATIIGYIVTRMFNYQSFDFLEPRKAASVAFLGLVISFVAGCVVVVYGGYANRNWAQADRIAFETTWDKFIPKYQKANDEKITYGLPRFVAKFSSPCDHTNQLAPIFKLFGFLAILTLVTHLVFVFVGIRQILLHG